MEDLPRGPAGVDDAQNLLLLLQAVYLFLLWESTGMIREKI